MACMLFSFLSRQLASYALFPPTGVLGAFSPESILGAFPPICKVGGFPPKAFGYLWSKRLTGPTLARLAAGPLHRNDIPANVPGKVSMTAARISSPTTCGKESRSKPDSDAELAINGAGLCV